MEASALVKGISRGLGRGIFEIAGSGLRSQKKKPERSPGERDMWLLFNLFFPSVLLKRRKPTQN